MALTEFEKRRLALEIRSELVAQADELFFMKIEAMQEQYREHDHPRKTDEFNFTDLNRGPNTTTEKETLAALKERIAAFLTQFTQATQTAQAAALQMIANSPAPQAVKAKAQNIIQNVFNPGALNNAAQQLQQASAQGPAYLKQHIQENIHPEMQQTVLDAHLALDAVLNPKPQPGKKAARAHEAEDPSVATDPFVKLATLYSMGHMLKKEYPSDSHAEDAKQCADLFRSKDMQNIIADLSASVQKQTHNLFHGTPTTKNEKILSHLLGSHGLFQIPVPRPQGKKKDHDRQQHIFRQRS